VKSKNDVVFHSQRIEAVMEKPVSLLLAFPRQVMELVWISEEERIAEKKTAHLHLAK
jgi:hypothetical protein